MLASYARLLSAPTLLMLLAACSSNPAPAAAAVAAKPAKAASALPPSAPPATSAGAFTLVKGSETNPITNCASILKPADVADIITGGEYTLNRDSMTSQSGQGCEIGIGASFSAFLEISSSKRTRQLWDSIASTVPHRPLAGLGDAAYETGSQESNVPGASETDVVAIKGDVDCNVELIQRSGPDGEKAVVPKTHDEIVKRLAGLCEKFFAR